MTQHTFSGEHSWYIFDIADNLPDNFSAKTDYNSPTRQILNTLVAVPVMDSLYKQDVALYEKIGVITNHREVGYVTTYDIETPADPQNDNYVWNSQFDVPYGSIPSYWTTSGTVSLTSESMLGINGCSINSGGYIEQTVRLPNYGGTWYVGLYSKADANFTVTVSWTGSSTNKTVAGTSQWRKASWSFSIPSTVNEITVKINGACVCDRVYVSHNNEYTHCNYDRPWFMDELSDGILYYGIDSSTTDRVFMYNQEENMLLGYPITATVSTGNYKYEYQTISISGETEIALSLVPDYTTLTGLNTKLEADYGHNFAVRLYSNGVWYNNTDDPLTNIDHTRALYISSDVPVSITLRGKALPQETVTFLTSSEHLNYYDSRFNTIGDLLDHYDCSYTGTGTIAVHQIVELTNTHGSIRLCYQPPDQSEPVGTNLTAGYVRAEFGTKRRLVWEYTDTTISCSPELLDDYVVNGATPAKFYSYNQDTGTITFDDIADYTIKGLLIDSTGVMYILTDESTPVLYISDICFIKPNQTHIPILSKIELPSITMDFSSDYLFGMYSFSNDLHLEDKDHVYKISLEYPYGCWSNGTFVTRKQYDNISVVANDHSNTH